MHVALLGGCARQAEHFSRGQLIANHIVVPFEYRESARLGRRRQVVPVSALTGMKNGRMRPVVFVLGIRRQAGFAIGGVRIGQMRIGQANISAIAQKAMQRWQIFGLFYAALGRLQDHINRLR